MLQPLHISRETRTGGWYPLALYWSESFRASVGQNSTQNPHPLHRSTLITTDPRLFFFCSVSTIGDLKGWSKMKYCYALKHHILRQIGKSNYLIFSLNSHYCMSRVKNRITAFITFENLFDRLSHDSTARVKWRTSIHRWSTLWYLREVDNYLRRIENHPDKKAEGGWW